MSHFVLMATYALLIACFFAMLWRRERTEQLKLLLQIRRDRHADRS